MKTKGITTSQPQVEQRPTPKPKAPETPAPKSKGWTPVKSDMGKLPSGVPFPSRRAMDPNDIHFTQNSVGDRYSTGGTVTDTAKALAHPETDGHTSRRTIPPARVFTAPDGKIYTLDNRRVAAAAAAGVPVPVREATPDEVRREGYKKTTTPQQGNGRFVGVRPSEETLKAINEERKAKGLPPFKRGDITIVGDQKRKG